MDTFSLGSVHHGAVLEARLSWPPSACMKPLIVVGKLSLTCAACTRGAVVLRSILAANRNPYAEGELPQMACNPDALGRTLGPDSIQLK